MDSKKLAFWDRIHAQQFDILTKTDNYTITTSDLGKLIILNSTTDKTFTLPNLVTSYGGKRIRVASINTGKLTIEAYSGLLINGVDYASVKGLYMVRELIVIDTSGNVIISSTEGKNSDSWELGPVDGYTYYKQFTILKDMVSGSSNLTDFPLVFKKSWDDLRTTGNGGYVTDSDGYDIIFTDEFNRLLDFEVEEYTATTGEIIAHIRIPILTYNEDTIIKVHYSNSSISSSQESVTDVWDTNFIGVYHLNGDVDDSTVYNNDGVNNGTDDVAAKISNGRSFVNEYIGLDSVVGEVLTTKGTLTCWLIIDTTSDDQQLWQLYADADNQIYAKYTNSTSTFRAGRIANSTDKYVETTVIVEASSEFRKITLTWDTVADELKVYLDGEQIGSTQTSIGEMTDFTEGDAWVQVAPQYGSEDRIYAMVVFNGKIYGGTYGNANLLEWNGTDAWVQVAPKYESETIIYAMVVFNGKIYGGTYPNGNLLEWNGTDAWVQVAPKYESETVIYAMVVFNGKIYGGTYGNGNLLEWNGTDAWVQVAPKYESEDRIHAMVVFNGKIYGGTYPNANLLEWNGTDAWVQVAPKYGSETIIFSMVVFNNKIYGGTYPNANLLEWNAVLGEATLNASTNLGATYNELSPWEGDVDEVRISDIARSADWERTEFLNQNSLEKYIR